MTPRRSSRLARELPPHMVRAIKSWYANKTRTPLETRDGPDNDTWHDEYLGVPDHRRVTRRSVETSASRHWSLVFRLNVDMAVKAAAAYAAFIEKGRNVRDAAKYLYDEFGIGSRSTHLPVCDDTFRQLVYFYITYALFPRLLEVKLSYVDVACYKLALAHWLSQPSNLKYGRALSRRRPEFYVARLGLLDNTLYVTDLKETVEELISRIHGFTTGTAAADPDDESDSDDDDGDDGGDSGGDSGGGDSDGGGGAECGGGPSESDTGARNLVLDHGLLEVRRAYAARYVAHQQELHPAAAAAAADAPGRPLVQPPTIRLIQRHAGAVPSVVTNTAATLPVPPSRCARR